MLRPSTRCGRPALGMALKGLEESGIMRSMVSSVALGPTEQLRPMASTGQESMIAGECFGVGAAGQVAEIVDGDLRDDGQIRAGHFPRGENRFAQLVQVGESFENQQIDARPGKHFDLFTERGAGLGEGHAAERFQADAERADGAGHEGTPLRSLAGQAHGRVVNIPQFVGEPESRQARRGGAEGIGFQNLSAGLNVFLVDLADEIRRREAQLIETTVDEDAAGVEHGSHGAIGYQDALGEPLAEFAGAGRGCCGHEEVRSGRGVIRGSYDMS